jgi:hypothetical protein
MAIEWLLAKKQSVYKIAFSITTLSITSSDAKGSDAMYCDANSSDAITKS